MFKKRGHPISKHKWSIGEKASDKLTQFVGSWAFISLLGVFIAIWIYLNLTAYIQNWDPWPFIILNLVLSCLAAVQAPIILMSQNRQAQKDRLRSEYDYKVNRRAEKEISEIRKQLNRIEKKLFKKK